MRQVWVISDDKSVSEQLGYALNFEVFGLRYRVLRADKVEQIPEEDILDAGVVFLVDAFHSPTAGFNGVRALRGRNCVGPVFLCGEPAPQEAVEPFSKGEITGFLPPVHRLDFQFAAGLIHYALTFEGDLKLSQFLSHGGRASTETIRTMQDFNQLTLKLINFVSRFGVDVQKIKKSLVSLCYSHVQAGASGITVHKPFKLSFGLDPKKIIIATNLDLNPLKFEEFRTEFCHSLQEHREGSVTPKNARPDFRTTSKLTENLTIIWGDASSSDWAKSEKAYVLVAIPFNHQTAKGERPYFFNFVRVHPSKEKAQEADSNAAPDLIAEIKLTPEGLPSSASHTAGSEESPEVEGPSSVFEPSILGDAPVTSAPSAEEALREAVLNGTEDEKSSGELEMPPRSEQSEFEDGESGVEEGAESEGQLNQSAEFDALQEKLEAAQKDLNEQRTLAKSLAVDVRRLMKERRQPISQGELKEINEELKGKCDRLQAQNKALIEEIAVKETRIKELDEQVKRLKVAA